MDEHEVSKYKVFSQRNYPVAILDKDTTTIKITSLLGTGQVSDKDTYIGEYMAHTFFRLFLQVIIF